MKRLIINADDFGLTEGVNNAILEGHRAGVITSATLMANSNRFAEAASTAQSNPSLGIGCHLMLVDGSPLAPAPSVASLLANESSQEFRQSFGAFAKAVLRGRVKSDDIEREALAQIARIQTGGIKPSHFDTHKHTHMFWGALEPLLRAARQTGIRALRNPFEPAWAMDLRIIAGFPLGWVRPLEVSILRRFMPGFRRLAGQYGMRFPDGTIGIALTGSLDMASFRKLLRSIPDGTWELVCHPGYSDGELDGIRTRLRKSREQELSLLTSEEARDLIRTLGIELISFREL